MSGPLKACIRLVVPAGKAAPSPKIGQALGSLGVNMMQFCKKFNAQTSDYAPGIPLRVKLSAFKDGTFSLTTRAPVTSWYIKEAAGVEKGANRPGHEIVGAIHVKQIYEIAKIKLQENERPNVTLESVCRTISANCKTMGIRVDATRNIT
mmetsp:Transcript_17723/g.24735  ORF Transcript_17723/g.24735 Transcript_17723/m.24735 type:complete len:150 (+) Transcript_17723:46-495(+)|eukprot:CAMPEP_0185257826 /NCGR_PEP_ID=MMETSP1359-20130426/6842_1 /TAXON_ID=552665 /ORGANISM="Bigelowiella longifila, Strain CCMP242" /LENGTH=149 /DNA_ID=CAMNT_0027843077 /DNA_START=46 /DNA_END=498 /DNA_ORIENTATION=-